MLETTTRPRRRRPSAILVLFVVLFGAGVFVYGVAHGRVPASVPSSATGR